MFKTIIIGGNKEYEFPFYESNQITDYDESRTIKTEYNYLLNMSVYSFTLEKVDELEKQIEGKKEELQTLQDTEVKDIWIHELGEFEKQYRRRY